MILLESTSRIAKGSSFKGDLSTAGKLIVAGQIEGNTNVHGVFQLDHAGRCDGDVEAHVIVVDGKINGNIHGEQRVEIRADAIVFGNITTPELLIHDGAKITGYVSIGRQPKLTLVNKSNTPDNVAVLKPKDKERISHYG